MLRENARLTQPSQKQPRRRGAAPTPRPPTPEWDVEPEDGDLAIWDANAFTHDEGASSGMYELSSRANHSCAPNAEWRTRGLDGH